MLAERKQSRSQRRWRRFLIFWSLALLLIGAAACFVFYQYLAVYEDTRPEAVMDAFLEQNDAESLLLSARGNVRLNLTEFENEEELYASYLQTIDTDSPLTYRSSLSESDSSHLAYIVRSGAFNLCTVVLTPQGQSPGFGRNYWTVSEIRSAPITDNLPSVSVQIETLAGQPAYLNGILISDAYLTDDSIPISNLNSLESRMDHPPTALLYTVGPLYGSLNVTDADGRSISPDGSSDNNVFHYRLTNGTNSLSIQAPEGISVSVNHVPLTSSDVSSTSIGIAADLPSYVSENEYRLNSYHFDGLYTDPEVAAVAPDGTELTPLLADSGTYYFFYNTDVPDAEHLKEVAEQYFSAYIRYTSMRYDDSLYWNLLNQVMPGTSLYDYLSTTRDTMYWAGYSEDIPELSFDNFHLINDSCFICTVTYNVDRTSTYWHEEVSAVQSGSYELAFVSTYGTWYAAAMNIIQAS